MPERRLKTSTVPVVWATFGIFSARSKWFPFAIGNHGRNLVISLWPGGKATMEWRHIGSPRPPHTIPSAKIRWKSFLGSRRHPPNWLSSKSPNYQPGVLLISAGTTEGHFEDKTPREGHQGALFLHDSATAHRALATQKKLAYLDFQCLDHPPYSPDLAPSTYHLFPGLKKQVKGCHFSSDTEVIAATETWLDGQPSDLFFEWLANVRTTS